MNRPGSSPTMKWRWLIAAMAPVNVVCTMCWFGLYTFVNGYVARGLHYSDRTWTALTLAFTGGLIFWTVLCSTISARIGRTATIALGMMTAGACYLAFAFTAHPAALAAIMFFTSFTVATVDAVWFPFVAEAGGVKPGRALAMNMLVNTVVTATLLVSLGALVGAARFRLCFMLVAGLCVACAGAFLFVAPHLRTTQGQPVVPLVKLKRADVVELMHGPFLVLMIAMAIEPFNFHTVNQLFPNLARAVYGLSEQSIGLIVGLGRLPALLTLIGIAAVVDRVNPVRAYGTAVCCVAAVIFAMSMTPGDKTLTGTYLAYFLCHGAVWGTNSLAVNTTVRPRLRDSAFAIMAIMMMGGQFLAGTWHNRMLAAGFSLPTLFAASAVIAAGGGLTVIIYSFTPRARRWMRPRAEAPVDDAAAQSR